MDASIADLDEVTGVKTRREKEHLLSRHMSDVGQLEDDFLENGIFGELAA